MTITEQTPVGDLAAAVPASLRVFERHGLDFCCGGKRSLAAVCDEAGLSAADIAGEIEAEADERPIDARDWRVEPLGRLLDHIVATFHEPLRSGLPNLQALSEKVVKAHGAKSPVFARLRTILDDLTADLLAHMMKEEAVLFPAIRRLEAGRPTGLPLEMPIHVMAAEHGQAGAMLQEMRTLTDGFAPPAWACPTLRALYAELERFEQAMHLHVHLENNVLFPRVVGTRPTRQ